MSKQLEVPRAYVGGNTLYDGPTDYMAIKNKQIAKYLEGARFYQGRANLFLLILIISVIGMILAPFGLLNLTGFIIAMLCIPVQVIFFRLRRTHRKSFILLEQLATIIQDVLEDSSLSIDEKQEEILQIETNFLNNDDELYTKKFIWTPFLEYKHDKIFYQWDQSRMYVPSGWGSDGKAQVPHPANYIHQEEIPAVWMMENPLDFDNSDEDFVFLNWRIKRRLRDLFFSWSYRRTFNILTDIGDIASKNAIVFERMLRSKKISKKLKVFKRLANINYLTPAAKMNLVSFVDEVLQERPYQQQCEAMIDLMAQKNAQIDRYSEAFWTVHRRSLKFYVAEVLIMLLAIPVIASFFSVWVNTGFLAAIAVFVLGGSAIAFGEMALVTRQVRDMKAKKLTPNLISSLIAIRHNMCSYSIMDEDVVYDYEQKYKEAEKHFMLTVTEIEAVKIAKENVSDKISERLTNAMVNLRQNKEAQAEVYYERFHFYRRQCLIYGAVELFIMLLMIPLVAAVFFAPLLAVTYYGALMLHLGWYLVPLAVFAAIEAVMLRNHMRTARRKELYLLIYQKMAVLLSNYKLFTDPVYIAKELHKLENSVVRAAEIDNMEDIAEHVSSIAVVDLSASQQQLLDNFKYNQAKLEIGQSSEDEEQFQGELDELHEDFNYMGASDARRVRSFYQ